jgi:hypothetical protein
VIQLDPSVLRLSSRRRGVAAAVVDNRRGTQPVRVSMRGDDPENSLQFAFRPSLLEVAAGRVARTAITIRAPGAPTGREVSRPFAVMASDGQSEVVAEGSVIQAGADRRPMARLLFTLLGALAMILGGFLPFWSGFIDGPNGGEARAADLTGNLVARFFADAEIGSTNNDALDGLIAGAERIASAALVMIVLGVIAVFGLTGRSGRLTRISAFVGALFVVVVLVAFAIGGTNGGVNEGLGEGAFLLLTGCVVAYVGGLLGRR